MKMAFSHNLISNIQKHTLKTGGVPQMPLCLCMSGDVGGDTTQEQGCVYLEILQVSGVHHGSRHASVDAQSEVLALGEELDCMLGLITY